MKGLFSWHMVAVVGLPVLRGMVVAVLTALLLAGVLPEDAVRGCLAVVAPGLSVL